MTKYELPNGTTVLIPTELLLRMSDAELSDYLANITGFQTSDPFYDSVLSEGEEIILPTGFELPTDVEELPEGFVEEDKE
jgi:hypothetical protein